jgi:predicted RND superfamily exporter protein
MQRLSSTLLRRLFRYPALIVGVIAVVTVFFAFQLPHARLDNNNLRFVPKDDAARALSAEIDETFGSSLFILVGLERRFGTVFDREFLERIQAYVDRIGEIDIAGTINSLVSTDYITSVEDTIVVENLVSDTFSGSAGEIAELRRRLLSWDMYRRSLISDDFTATQIYVPLTITAENAGEPHVVNSYLRIRDIAREMFSDLATVYVTGMPVISATLNEAMHADLILLIPLVILVVLFIVFLPLRRISFVALSMLAVVIAAIWSIGAMPLFGIKLSIITTVLPVILIAVGSSYGLHIIIHYIEESGTFDNMSREAHTEWVISLVEKLKSAIFLAAITTLVSFLSFCFTRVIPIREFGYFAAFGVFASFLIAITLTPALLIIRGPKPLHTLRIKASATSTPASRRIADFLSKLVVHKGVVLFVTAIIVLVSIYGASKIIIDNIFVEYFKPNTDIVKSDEFIREKFGGSKVISVVVKASSPEILLHPDTLSAVDGLNGYLTEKIEGTGKVMGFTDLVKRMNQVFNADESPDGLRKVSVTISDNDDFGFGEPDLAGSLEDTAVSSPLQPAADEDRPLTPRMLAELFDKTAGIGGDLVWETKKLVNYEGAAYYEVPTDPVRYGKSSGEELQRLVSNYLVLLSGSIDSYANDSLEPTAIKSTVQLRTIGQKDTDRVVGAIRAYIEARFPQNVEVVVGGVALVEASTNNNVVQSVWTSMLIALVSMFIIISISNRSIAAGFIAVITLAVLILLNFAIMGFAGIKINIGTALISSLTMGIGIDYTIHYLEAFKRAYRTSIGGTDLLKQTYITSGVAIITDAVSVGAGFAVLVLSNFNMLAEFGLLVALSMLLSALAGLIIVPALLLFFKPRFVEQ